ncbi:hypothetical protein A0H81_06458 [Grifola frondosa]|uniref:Transmembrane protein n=1 Tax=Grifola frondosa TaxID=5627 RepID=A0A1C7MBW0_GRIFR|nr:hypothetical protein A0H81_06458 [Grifola frondosa]
MLDSGRRLIHRRVNAGGALLRKGFTPTAIFTTYDTATNGAATTSPATSGGTQDWMRAGGLSSLKSFIVLVDHVSERSQSELLYANSGDITFHHKLPTALPTSSTPIPATTSTAAAATATNTSTSTQSTSSAASSTSTSTSPSSTQTSVTQTSTPAASTSSSSSPKAAVNTYTSSSSITPANTVTATLTQTGANSAASAGAASPSVTGTSSGVNTGAVVGGIIAAVVGLGGIIFAVVYFMRRRRSDDDIDEDFNAQAFRRQSAVLADDMTTSSGPNYSGPNYGGRGTTPRPPTMIEQRMANVPMSYGGQQPPVAQVYGTDPNGYNYAAHASFTPGQSPIGSPVSVAPYDSAYDAQGRMVQRQPSYGAASYLSRQPSIGNAMDTPNEAHYVDLSRSSVTPFQAAQYEEISRRLNTAPPISMPTPAIEEEIAAYDEKAPVPPQKDSFGQSVEYEPQYLAVQPAPLEHSLPESPFADPNMQEQPVSGKEPVTQEQDGHASVLAETALSIHDSFPQPPSASFAGAPRITSTPPILPEIQARPFSPVTYEFPNVPGKPSPSLSLHR